MNHESVSFFVYGEYRGKDKHQYLKKVSVRTTEVKSFTMSLAEQLFQLQYSEVENYVETESTSKGVYIMDPKSEGITGRFQEFILKHIDRINDPANPKEVNELNKLIFVTHFKEGFTGFSTIKKRKLFVNSKRFYLFPSDEFHLKAMVKPYIFEASEFYFFLIRGTSHIIFDPVEYGSYFDLAGVFLNKINSHKADYSKILSDPAPVLSHIEKLGYAEAKAMAANLDSLPQLTQDINKIKASNDTYHWGLKFTRDGKIDTDKSDPHGILKCLRDRGVRSPTTNIDYDAIVKKRVR